MFLLKTLRRFRGETKDQDEEKKINSNKTNRKSPSPEKKLERADNERNDASTSSEEDSQPYYSCPSSNSNEDDSVGLNRRGGSISIRIPSFEDCSKSNDAADNDRFESTVHKKMDSLSDSYDDLKGSIEVLDLETGQLQENFVEENAGTRVATKSIDKSDQSTRKFLKPIRRLKERDRRSKQAEKVGTKSASKQEHNFKYSERHDNTPRDEGCNKIFNNMERNRNQPEIQRADNQHVDPTFSNDCRKEPSFQNHSANPHLSQHPNIRPVNYNKDNSFHQQHLFNYHNVEQHSFHQQHLFNYHNVEQHSFYEPNTNQYFQIPPNDSFNEKFNTPRFNPPPNHHQSRFENPQQKCDNQSRFKASEEYQTNMAPFNFDIINGRIHVENLRFGHQVMVPPWVVVNGQCYKYDESPKKCAQPNTKENAQQSDCNREEDKNVRDKKCCGQEINKVANIDEGITDSQNDSATAIITKEEEIKSRIASRNEDTGDVKKVSKNIRGAVTKLGDKAGPLKNDESNNNKTIQTEAMTDGPSKKGETSKPFKTNKNESKPFKTTLVETKKQSSNSIVKKNTTPNVERNNDCKSETNMSKPVSETKDFKVNMTKKASETKENAAKQCVKTNITPVDKPGKQFFNSAKHSGEENLCSEKQDGIANTDPENKSFTVNENVAKKLDEIDVASSKQSDKIIAESSKRHQIKVSPVKQLNMVEINPTKQPEKITGNQMNRPGKENSNSAKHSGKVAVISSKQPEKLNVNTVQHVKVDDTLAKELSKVKFSPTKQPDNVDVGLSVENSNSRIKPILKTSKKNKKLKKVTNLKLTEEELKKVEKLKSTLSLNDTLEHIEIKDDKYFPVNSSSLLRKTNLKAVTTNITDKQSDPATPVNHIRSKTSVKTPTFKKTNQQEAIPTQKVGNLMPEKTAELACNPQENVATKANITATPKTLNNSNTSKDVTLKKSLRNVNIPATVTSNSHKATQKHPKTSTPDNAKPIDNKKQKLKPSKIPKKIKEPVTPETETKKTEEKIQISKIEELWKNEMEKASKVFENMTLSPIKCTLGDSYKETPDNTENDKPKKTRKILIPDENAYRRPIPEKGLPFLFSVKKDLRNEVISLVKKRDQMYGEIAKNKEKLSDKNLQMELDKIKSFISKMKEKKPCLAEKPDLIELDHNTFASHRIRDFNIPKLSESHKDAIERRRENIKFIAKMQENLTQRIKEMQSKLDEKVKVKDEKPEDVNLYEQFENSILNESVTTSLYNFNSKLHRYISKNNGIENAHKILLDHVSGVDRPTDKEFPVLTCCEIESLMLNNSFEKMSFDHNDGEMFDEVNGDILLLQKQMKLHFGKELKDPSPLKTPRRCPVVLDEKNGFDFPSARISGLESVDSIILQSIADIQCKEIEDEQISEKAMEKPVREPSINNKSHASKPLDEKSSCSATINYCLLTENSSTSFSNFDDNLRTPNNSSSSMPRNSTPVNDNTSNQINFDESLSVSFDETDIEKYFKFEKHEKLNFSETVNNLFGENKNIPLKKSFTSSSDKTLANALMTELHEEQKKSNIDNIVSCLNNDSETGLTMKRKENILNRDERAVVQELGSKKALKKKKLTVVRNPLASGKNKKNNGGKRKMKNQDLTKQTERENVPATCHDHKIKDCEVTKNANNAKVEIHLTKSLEHILNEKNITETSFEYSLPKQNKPANEKLDQLENNDIGKSAENVELTEKNITETSSEYSVPKQHNPANEKLDQLENNGTGILVKNADFTEKSITETTSEYSVPKQNGPSGKFDQLENNGSGKSAENSNLQFDQQEINPNEKCPTEIHNIADKNISDRTAKNLSDCQETSTESSCNNALEQITTNNRDPKDEDLNKSIEGRVNDDCINGSVKSRQQDGNYDLCANKSNKEELKNKDRKENVIQKSNDASPARKRKNRRGKKKNNNYLDAGNHTNKVESTITSCNVEHVTNSNAEHEQTNKVTVKQESYDRQQSNNPKNQYNTYIAQDNETAVVQDDSKTVVKNNAVAIVGDIAVPVVEDDALAVIRNDTVAVAESYAVAVAEDNVMTAVQSELSTVVQDDSFWDTSIEVIDDLPNNDLSEEKSEEKKSTDIELVATDSRAFVKISLKKLVNSEIVGFENGGGEIQKHTLQYDFDSDALSRGKDVLIKKSRHGFSLHDCIDLAVENLTRSPIEEKPPIVVCDTDCYWTHQELISNYIKSIQVNKFEDFPKAKFYNNSDVSLLDDCKIDCHGNEFVVTVELRRNLANRCFPIASWKNKKEIMRIEKLLKNCCRSLNQKYKGSLTPIISRGDDAVLELVNKGVINRHVLSKGASIYKVKGGRVLIVINEEDHFRITATNRNGDFKKILTDVKDVESLLESWLSDYEERFARMEPLGYLCPNLLHTGLSCTLFASIKLEHLHEFKHLSLLLNHLNFGLRIEENKKQMKQHIYTFFTKDQYRVSELDLAIRMKAFIKLLLTINERLGRGELSIADLFVQL